MSDAEKNSEWTLPVINSESTSTITNKSSRLSNTAWKSVAIGVVTKKILKNEANEEYPFEMDNEA